MKAGFPLSAADVARRARRARVEAPALARDAYSLDELLDEVVRPSGRVLAVQVHKHRRRLHDRRLHGRADRRAHRPRSTRTIAVESEDPALVLAAVRELGLESRRNVSYPRGLTSLAGLGSRRFAVIDVGTNSVKFHVGERGRDGEWRTVVDRAEVTRLGEGLDATGGLGEEPMERTAAAIAAMAEEARQDGVEEIAAVGTAGMRIAANAPAFVAAVRERCGVEIEVIPGEEEARLAFRRGRRRARPRRRARSSSSTPAAAARSSPSARRPGGRAVQRERRRGAVHGALRPRRGRLGGDAGRGAGRDRRRPRAARRPPGAGRARRHGRRRDEPRRRAARARRRTTPRSSRARCSTAPRSTGSSSSTARAPPTSDAAIAGLQPKRAEVILAGACIVSTVLDKLGRDSFTVSDRGLRHGLIVERFGP